MKLPNVIKALIAAQNQFDSFAYANCFSETAIVFDEGKTYHGKTEIEQWIKTANQHYQAIMQPIAYFETEEILKTKVSGNFEGSPIVLKYQFELKNDLIESLKIV